MTVTNRLILTTVCAVTVTACSYSAYDEGDGVLSYTRAEMVDVTIRQGRTESIVTDDGVSLDFPASLSFTDKTTDGTKRLLLYYNKVDGQSQIEVVSYANVLLLTPAVHSETDCLDPLKLVSAWRSANGKYANVTVGVMLGDSDKQQGVKLVCNYISAKGRGHAHYILMHNQNGVPQYYTGITYLSFEWPAQDTVSVTLPTYDGMVTRTLCAP